MHETPIRLTGVTVEEGTATGTPLVLAEPLSFWGGYDAARGIVVDARHPNAGAALAGRVMIMSRSKGSSSSSSVLAEAIRNGTGPAAIVMQEPDLIVALGAIVARELYGIVVPMVVLPQDAWSHVLNATGNMAVIAAAGGMATVSWTAAGEGV